MKEGEFAMVGERPKLTSLELFDLQDKSKRLKGRYESLSQLAALMSQSTASEEGLSQLEDLVRKVNRKHAECSADLEAILRIIGYPLH